MIEKKCDKLHEKRGFFSGAWERWSQWWCFVNFEEWIFLILEVSKFHVSRRQYEYKLWIVIVFCLVFKYIFLFIAYYCIHKVLLYKQRQIGPQSLWECVKIILVLYNIPVLYSERSLFWNVCVVHNFLQFFCVVIITAISDFAQICEI